MNITTDQHQYLDDIIEYTYEHETYMNDIIEIIYENNNTTKRHYNNTYTDIFDERLNLYKYNANNINNIENIDKIFSVVQFIFILFVLYVLLVFITIPIRVMIFRRRGYCY